MIRYLKLSNVGPAADMELEFGSRLNLLTGDNGLGKSFLLDIIWWALTRKWPAEVNAKLTAGKIALPTEKSKEYTIKFSISAASKDQEFISTFQPRTQSWSLKMGRHPNPGLVFYAMADGGFAVWDPARNYWKAQNEAGTNRPAAYVFSPKEVWDGLNREDDLCLCNGLIRDWANWQNKNGWEFNLLKKVLQDLSPDSGELLTPGELTRISLDDVRDMPTLKMPYGQDVPVVHASSGMRRIIALAYFLVWCWEEHKKAKKLIGEPLETKAVMLVDEAESHLYPSWQRKIIPAILSVMNELEHSIEVQFIASTHSPLLMASVEPQFHASSDAWFDIELLDGRVELTKRQFSRNIDAINSEITDSTFD
ncbi:MAG: AAA family ATPase [Desulfovibrio sp.]|nr:AAA family ATPase [Desulfovibrio sp.]